MRRTIVFGKCSFPISPFFFFLLLCFSAFLLFPCLLACFSAFLCFPASLLFCFFVSLLLCFNFLLFCFFASLLLRFSAFPASPLLRLSAFPASLLLLFSAFPCFSAYSLFCFSAFPCIFFFVSQFSQINPKKHHFNHFNKPSTSPKSILSTVNPKPTPEKLKQLQVNRKHTLNQLTTMYIYIYIIYVIYKSK